MNALRHNMQRTTIFLLVLMLVSVQSAAAHAGHAHSSDDNLNVSTMLSVAGVIVALGIAWRATSRFSRIQELSGDEEDHPIA